jgi:hypothetical protein
MSMQTPAIWVGFSALTVIAYSFPRAEHELTEQLLQLQE